MNIVFESAPEGTTHFLRYASGHIVWCKIDEGQNNQLILSEWDSGNEYWVPGIFPVEHYQKIGLASIDDLPTQNDVGPDAAAPKGSTHRYQHGGETSWYRETEDNLFVWRDGSWYASTQKSASDLAKVCPFGAVTILTQEVQLAEDGEDDLTWLAMNVHDMDGDSNLLARCGSEWIEAKFVAQIDDGAAWFTRDQWLARRAELQNKPSWKDAPEWATHLAQNARGQWWFMLEGKLCDDGLYYFSSIMKTPEITKGEVLGDWRDTLERRPVDLSEPAGGVKARGTDDTEIIKRNAAVCGGEAYLNNRWFERGELPPVGTAVQLWHGGTYAYDCELIAKRGGDFVLWNLTWERPDSADCMMCDFRPIHTERDELVNVFINHYGNPKGAEGYIRIADAILAAGYSKETK